MQEQICSVSKIVLRHLYLAIEISLSAFTADFYNESEDVVSNKIIQNFRRVASRSAQSLP